MKAVKSIGIIGLIIILVTLAIIMSGSGETAVSAREETAPVDSNSTEITTTLVAGGFTYPVAIANAGDNRLFVVERTGIIKIIDANGNVLATPFLNIENLVQDSPNERGLLGLVFHPNYPTTPYFYVNYTTVAGGGHANGDTIIARFEVNPATPNIADGNSRVEIMDITQPDWNHNAGDLKFGPDGYLYIPTGDGGSSGDPDNYAQTMSTLLGKMLRVDVDGGGNAPECDGNGNYTIPANNPFVDGSGSNCDEIWALGLRNPWRFSFDRDTGAMFIGDVGQGSWEEIDYQPPGVGGQNWGWRCYEGLAAFNTNGCGPASSYDDPIFAYGHNANGGFAVSGGFVYRGEDYPAIDGVYYFADYSTGNHWSAVPDGGSGWTIDPLGQLPNVNSPSTFGEGCDGELYVAHYASSNGAIYQIQAAPAVPTGHSGADSFSFLPLIEKDEDTSPPTDTPTPTSTGSPPPPTSTMTPTATITATPGGPTPTFTPTPEPLVCN